MIGLFLWILFLAICGFGYPGGIIVVVLTILSPFILGLGIFVIAGLIALLKGIISIFLKS